MAQETNTFNLNEIVNSVVEYEVTEGSLNTVIPSRNEFEKIVQKINELTSSSSDISVEISLNDLLSSLDVNDNPLLSNYFDVLSSQTEKENENENNSLKLNYNYVEFNSRNGISILLNREMFETKSESLSLASYDVIVKTPYKINMIDTENFQVSLSNDITYINQINNDIPKCPLNISNLSLVFSRDLSGDLSVDSFYCDVSFNFDDAVNSVMSSIVPVEPNAISSDQFTLVDLTDDDKLLILEETTNIFRNLRGYVQIKNYQTDPHLSAYAEQLSAYAETLTFEDFNSSVINSENVDDFLDYCSDIPLSAVSRDIDIENAKTQIAKGQSYGKQLLTMLDENVKKLESISNEYDNIEPKSLEDLPEDDETSNCCILINKYETAIETYRNTVRGICALRKDLENKVTSGDENALFMLIGLADGLSGSSTASRALISFLYAVKRQNRDGSPRAVITMSTLLLICLAGVLIGGALGLLGYKLENKFLMWTGIAIGTISLLAMAYFGYLALIQGVTAISVTFRNQLGVLAEKIGTTINNASIDAYIKMENTLNQQVVKVTRVLESIRNAGDGGKIVKINNVPVIMGRPTKFGLFKFSKITDVNMTIKASSEPLKNLETANKMVTEAVTALQRNPSLRQVSLNSTTTIVRTTANALEMRTVSMQIASKGGQIVASNGLNVGQLTEVYGPSAAKFYTPVNLALKVSQDVIDTSLANGTGNTVFGCSSLNVLSYKELIQILHNVRDANDDNLFDEIDVNDPYFYIIVGQNVNDEISLDVDATKTLQLIG